jgi:hypothetical protein
MFHHHDPAAQSAYSFYEETDCVSDHLRTQNTKGLFGSSNEEAGRIYSIFKGTVSNKNFHDTSKDNRVTLADFAIHINSAVKGTIFPHSNTYEYTYTPHYQTDHMFMTVNGIQEYQKLFTGSAHHTAHCVTIAKLRDRLSASQQEKQRFHTERFHLK